MQIHELQRKNKNKKNAPVGRGGKRGKTSGRGTKGQSARAGRKYRPQLRDIIKKLPKRRGRGKNIFQSFQAPQRVVSIEQLELTFKAGETVTPTILIDRKVIKKYLGKSPKVKIVGDGILSKALTISRCGVSESAKEKILKAGGTIKL